MNKQKFEKGWEKFLTESYQDKLEDLLANVGNEGEIQDYIDSLNRDQNQKGYEDFTDDDYIEDFRNHIADKGLEETERGITITNKGKNHKHNWVKIDPDGTTECKICGLRNSWSEKSLNEENDDFWGKDYNVVGGYNKKQENLKIEKLVNWFKQFMTSTLQNGAGAQEHEIDAYFQSVARDILKTGLENSDYNNWDFNDYVEDIKNFIADKGL